MTVRVTEQRSSARTVIAFSLAVIACCTLTFIIMLLAGSSAVRPQQPTPPQRVLDADAVERAVLNKAQSKGEFAKPPTIDDVVCPASITVKVGREFDCYVFGVGDDTNIGQDSVQVKIEDDQGSLSLD